MSETEISYALKLQIICSRLGKSADKVASVIGVNAGTVFGIIDGQYQTPRRKNAEIIDDWYLRVTKAELVRGDDSLVLK